jgi:hypothetical protein
MKREFCERIILECEQLGQKMGMDFHETMKKAPGRDRAMEAIHSDSAAGLAKR